MGPIANGFSVATIGYSLKTLFSSVAAIGIEALALSANKVTTNKVARIALCTIAGLAAAVSTSFALPGAFVGVTLLAVAQQPATYAKGIAAIIGAVALTTLSIYGHVKAFQWSLK